MPVKIRFRDGLLRRSTGTSDRESGNAVGPHRLTEANFGRAQHFPTPIGGARRRRHRAFVIVTVVSAQRRNLHLVSTCLRLTRSIGVVDRPNGERFLYDDPHPPRSATATGKPTSPLQHPPAGMRRRVRSIIRKALHESGTQRRGETFAWWSALALVRTIERVARAKQLASLCQRPTTVVDDEAESAGHQPALVSGQNNTTRHEASRIGAATLTGAPVLKATSISSEERT